MQRIQSLSRVKQILMAACWNGNQESLSMLEPSIQHAAIEQARPRQAATFQRVTVRAFNCLFWELVKKPGRQIARMDFVGQETRHDCPPLDHL